MDATEIYRRQPRREVKAQPVDQVLEGLSDQREVLRAMACLAQIALDLHQDSRQSLNGIRRRLALAVPAYHRARALADRA